MAAHHGFDYDPARDDEDAIEKSGRLDALRAALDLLDEHDKRIVELRYFEQLSNQMVAQTLGLSHQAASMRYLRAMRRLRKLLPRRKDDA